MSTNKTKNLGLHSWVRSDPFNMDEFNENFDKLDQAVGGKAEQDALEALTGQVAAKAEQSALAALTGRVDNKAEQTALEAQTAALAALTGRVGTLETGQLRFKFGEYPGTGESGYEHPSSLTFDFKPMLVIIREKNDARSDAGLPWIREIKNGPSTTGWNSTLTWGENTLSWYSSDVVAQLNAKGAIYYYAAFGIAE